MVMSSKVTAPSDGVRKRKGRPRDGRAGEAAAVAEHKKPRTSKALGAAAPLVEADSEALRSEVAAFASSLGLAAAPDGFDDSDFRPEAARRPLGSGAAAAAKEDAGDEHARGAKPSGGKHASKREPGGAKAAPQGRQQQPPVSGAAAGKAGAAGKGRAWNEGAGPPPGEQQAYKQQAYICEEVERTILLGCKGRAVNSGLTQQSKVEAGCLHT